MNEAETKAEYIDPVLASAGWDVVDRSRIRREYTITLGRIEGQTQGQRGHPQVFRRAHVRLFAQRRVHRHDYRRRGL